MSAKILLVEDDPGLGFVIKDSLIHRNYDVTLCVNGEEALDTFSAQTFDLCILDVMLPKKDGFSLAKSIRSNNHDIPILFATAKNHPDDKVVGFEAGGDDYIIKPFSIDELCYRIEVFLRRSNGHHHVASFKIGSYEFDCNRMTLSFGKESKTLTQKEVEVLKLLCINRNRVIRREEILKSIWGDDDYFMGRSLDVFVSRLRKYLSLDPTIQIVNYHGVGFRLEAN